MFDYYYYVDHSDYVVRDTDPGPWWWETPDWLRELEELDWDAFEAAYNAENNIKHVAED